MNQLQDVPTCLENYEPEKYWVLRTEGEWLTCVFPSTLVVAFTSETLAVQTLSLAYFRLGAPKTIEPELIGLSEILNELRIKKVNLSGHPYRGVLIDMKERVYL